MAAADPDAIWKPGFTGEVRYGTPAPSRPRRRRGVVVAMGVLAVVAVTVVAAVVAITRHDEASGQPARRWTATVSGEVSEVTASADVVVTVAIDSSGRSAITALRRHDGHELWSEVEPGTAGVMYVRGDVVTYFSDGLGRPTVTGVGAHGTPALALAAGLGEGVFVTARASYVSRSDAAGRTVHLAALDPAAGDVAAEVGGDDITLNPDFDDDVHVRRDDTFEVRDPVSLALVGRVELPDLHGRPAQVARTPDRWAAVTRQALTTYDGAGRLVATMPRPVGDADPTIGSVGGCVVVDDGTTVTAVQLDGQQLQRRWTVDGAALDVLDVDGHGWVLVATPGQDPADGSSLVEVVDAMSGVVVWTGTVDLRWEMARDGPLQPDGLVAALGNTGGDVAHVVAGVGFDGKVRWRHVTTQPNIALVPGGLVEYGPADAAGDRTAISLSA